MKSSHTPSKWLLSPALLLLVCLTEPAPHVNATGPVFPERWLDDGAALWERAPEFFWADELRRWAKEFLPPEKRVTATAAQSSTTALSADDSEDGVRSQSRLTVDADERDFEDAVASGRFKPDNLQEARTRHREARQKLLAASKPQPVDAPGPNDDSVQKDAPAPMEDPVMEDWAEAPSEFSDYHTGARAYLKGEDFFDEARTSWQDLLNRPPEERYYRTVWATFMLGKLALAAEENPEAVYWFQLTRQYAAEGFSDTTGLAADSYGWEGLAQLLEKNLESSAELYLTQLALGDDSAIESLKYLVPDLDETRKEGEIDTTTPDSNEIHASAAAPLLRRLTTLHVLASSDHDLCTRWLEELESLKLTRVEDAQFVGWVAYTAGRFEEAERWLSLADSDHVMSLWLKARLLRRAGQREEAAVLTAEVLKRLRAGSPNTKTSYFNAEDGIPFGQVQYAAGDLAGLKLLAADFVSAMEGFWVGKLWYDAAFLADWVLTIEELKLFVDQHVPAAPAPLPPTEPIFERDFGVDEQGLWLRALLARRLVRAGNYREARTYLPEKLVPRLDRFAAEMRNFEDTKKPKKLRAQSGFTAAWIARHSGMELMGMFEEPDGFWSDGGFEARNLDRERGQGATESDANPITPGEEPLVIQLPSTPEEQARIQKHGPTPNKRFHYRYVAAEIAWKAAGLLENGSEELADVLNTAGGWLKSRDEEAAGRFYLAIEKRCSKTKIGATAIKRRWFSTSDGPWSRSLRKELPPG